jgi:hypothetical protein
VQSQECIATVTANIGYASGDAVDCPQLAELVAPILMPGEWDRPRHMAVLAGRGSPHARWLFPFQLKLYADSGYQRPKFQLGLRQVCRKINVEIVKRSNAGKFVVLPSAGSSNEPSAG